MAKARGIKLSEARSQLAREKALGEKGARIEKALGDRTGGSFLDGNGELVVTALDNAAKNEITANGARAKLVDDSEARLDSIMRQLDRQAAQNGPGKSQGWRVDVPTNTVVVTLTDGASDAQTAAIEKLASGFGASVRIEEKPADQAPRLAEWMVGGYQFVPAAGGSCSVGFNTVDASNRPVVLTAGHCITAGMNSRNGFGSAAPGPRTSRPMTSGRSGTPTRATGAVSSVFRYDTGTYPRVVGYWNNPPIGTTVCKSGRTTGWTCGPHHGRQRDRHVPGWQDRLRAHAPRRLRRAGRQRRRQHQRRRLRARHDQRGEHGLARPLLGAGRATGTSAGTSRLAKP